MRCTIVILSTILVVMASAGPSQATITTASVSPSSSGGILEKGGDFVVAYKDFNPFVGLGPVDLNVTVDAAGDYWLEEKSYSGWNGFIHNISGQTWTDFHFELVAPSGFNFAAGSASNDVFSTVALTSTTIDLSNGTVPDGTDFHAVFAVHADGPGSFTVRETATVPEPATLSLLALGGLATLLRRRRK